MFHKALNMVPRPLINGIVAVIGTALIGSGLYGVFSPNNMARVFGIIDVTRDMTVFYPGLGVRNFSAGLAVWSLFLGGQRKAVGTLLLCWDVVGVVDTWILLNHDRPVDTIGVHVFNTILLLSVGTALVRGN